MASAVRQQPKRGVDKKELERQRERERAERPKLLKQLVLASISPYRFGDFQRFPVCHLHGAYFCPCLRVTDCVDRRLID